MNDPPVPVSPGVPQPGPTTPRLLLVEDDPTSAAFLLDAASRLPAQVHGATGLIQARRACDDLPFDLLLIDAHLPDGTGVALLQALRGSGLRAPAIAHTAETSPVLHAQLLAAGFVEVLRKPMAVADLHAALRRQLGGLSIWNDAAALAVMGGRAEQVALLRRMFLAELPAQRARLACAQQSQDAAAVRAELHRLEASCGFVGALQLADTVRAMRDAPLDAGRWQALDDAVAALLSASAPAPTATTG